MTMFGTDNLVYVPEGSPLVMDNVYTWTRSRLDVLQFGVKVRPAAVETVAARVRHAAASADAAVASFADRLLAEIATHAGSANSGVRGALRAELDNDTAVWWLRLTDRPAESWHEDDYERLIPPTAAGTEFLTFGSVEVSALDGLEVSLSGDDPEQGMPFSIEVPPSDGIVHGPMPVDEPLALIHEFCGVNGVSSRGHTINLTTRGAVPEYHQFCLPLGRIGTTLLATLYIHVNTPAAERIVEPLSHAHLMRCIDLLERSRFERIAEGNLFRIYRRGGDVIHVYTSLDGKESEGVDTMPPLALVAMAGGGFEPAARAELLQSLLETARQ
jgi:hypothetical protein